jgi:hypothetical protein
MRIPELEFDFDDELSLKVFTNNNFAEQAISFSNKAIYGSCFLQETPDSNIFPEGMTNVTFVNCNLDNVVIPDGCTVINTNGAEAQRFAVQNDLNDWIIDSKNAPVAPVDYKFYEKKGLPVPDPKDIPAQKVSEPVDLLKAAEQKKAEGGVVVDVGVIK